MKPRRLSVTKRTIIALENQHILRLVFVVTNQRNTADVPLDFLSWPIGSLGRFFIAEEALF